MAEDVVMLKPAINGLGLDLNELWRRFRAKNDLRSIAARRFLQAFEAHGVRPTQIPRFLPEISLAHLEPDSLLDVLSDGLLARTAELLGIRREWLEGIDDRIYAHRFCYKIPSSFLGELSAIRLDQYSFPVRVLYCGKATAEQGQPLALILVERIGEIGDEDIFRYRVYADAWNWNHFASRIQLKAIARIVNLKLNKPVPLYEVSNEILTEIRDGRRVPRAALHGCLLTDPSLEDFGLAEEESAVAKETEELPDVLSYIREHRLDDALSLRED
jgi:hypothetical protein